VLGGLEAARYTAAHPAGRFAFVTDPGRGEVVTVDVLRGRIVGRLRVGGPVRHVSLDRRGKTLWVALGTKAENIAVVDVARPAQPRLVARFAPPFLAHDVALPPGGGPAWVTSGDRGAIALYDARRRRGVRTFHATRRRSTSPSTPAAPTLRAATTGLCASTARTTATCLSRTRPVTPCLRVTCPMGCGHRAVDSARVVRYDVSPDAAPGARS